MIRFLQSVDRRRAALAAAAVLLGTGLLAFLLSRVDTREAAEALRQVRIDAGSSSLLLALLIVTNVLRGQRFRVIYGEHGLSLGLSTAIVFVGNFVSGILPSHLGDFSYPYLLRRTLGVGYAHGVSALIVLRLLDFATIALLSLASMAAVPSAIGITIGVVPFAIGIIAAISALLAGMTWIARNCRLPLARTTATRFGPLRKALTVLAKGLDALRDINSPAKLAWLLLASLGIWLSNYLFGLVIIMHLPIHVGIARVFFGLNLANVIGLLPVHGIAGLGTYEAAWTGAFVLVGVSETMAVLSGLTGHLIRLGLSAILAMVGAWRISAQARHGLP